MLLENCVHMSSSTNPTKRTTFLRIFLVMALPDKNSALKQVWALNPTLAANRAREILLEEDRLSVITSVRLGLHWCCRPVLDTAAE